MSTFFKYDKEDQNIVDCFKWFMLEGYAVTKINGKLVSFHRLVMGLPSGQIDHINRDRLDNRKCNLRVVTSSDNQLNRGGNKIYKNKGRRFYFRIRRHKKLGEFVGYGSENIAQAALAFIKNAIICEGSSICGTYSIPICYNASYIGKNFEKFKKQRAGTCSDLRKIESKHFTDQFMKTCSKKLSIGDRLFIATTPDSYNKIGGLYGLHETQFYRIRKDWKILTECQKDKIIKFLAN